MMPGNNLTTSNTWNCEQEPLARPQDIPRFCDETGIRVALDETVDEDTIDDRDHLQECSSSGVVAMVRN
jgi:hypothetical protein